MQIASFQCGNNRKLRAGTNKRGVLEYATRKQLLSDLKEELGAEFKDNTEELKQIDNAIKENKKKVGGLLDSIDKSHRDIINERLDKLRAERQFLEE
ncbi:MAG: hypothetical protein ACE5IT_02030 [bacterium]